VIIKYLKELSSKLFAKFSYITGICGVIAFYYSKYDPSSIVTEFVVNYFLYVFVLFLTISSYQVWLKAKQELDEIKKNPVDYKVTAKIRNIYIDLNKVTDQYLNDESLNKKIRDCNNEIDRFDGKNFVYNAFELLKNSNKNLPDNTGNKPKDQYISELKSYKEELEEYINKSKDNLLQWNKFSDSFKNVYIVDFY
jgi:hypothetical protein